MRIKNIQERLLDTTSLLSSLESALAEHPDDKGLMLSMSSLERKREELEAEFTRAADELGLDICRYRMIPEGGKASARTIAESLGAFQDWLSVTYSACKSGKKDLVRFGADVEEATRLDFGYAFSGSIGFVFTMPNDRLLFAGTKLDEAIDAIRRMAEARDAEQMATFAETLGRGPITAMYKWVCGNEGSETGVDICWQHRAKETARIKIQPLQLSRLKKAIERTSEKITRTKRITGELVGADLNRRRFHLIADGRSIEGKLDDDVLSSTVITLGRPYTGILSTTTETVYSTGKQDVTCVLSDLELVEDESPQSSVST